MDILTLEGRNASSCRTLDIIGRNLPAPSAWTELRVLLLRVLILRALHGVWAALPGRGFVGVWDGDANIRSAGLESHGLLIVGRMSRMVMGIGVECGR